MAASVVASATALTAGAGSVVSLRSASGLSSSAAFGSPIVNVAPVRPVAKRYVMVARSALSEETSGKAARRQVLAGLMAAGAALATAGRGMADTDVVDSTSEKADDLLKKADELTTNESPPRVGPGRVGGDETGQLAQKAGVGAVEDIQGGANTAVEKAKKTADTARDNFNKMFSQNTNKSGDLAASVLDDPAGKVSSDLDSTRGKVESDISSASEAAKKVKGESGGFFGIGGKVDDVKGDADSFVAEAKSKADDVTSKTGVDGQGIFDSIVSKVKDVVPQ